MAGKFSLCPVPIFVGILYPGQRLDGMSDRFSGEPKREMANAGSEC
jgi:hypothetical protein